MSELKVETKGHVLMMGLNRPDKGNAITVDMYFDLARALYTLDQDKDLRCGVLYAEGKHFTSGLDLPQWVPIFAAGKMDLADDMMDPMGFIQDKMCRKPLVMAIQGVCYTIGVELLLACDVRVAAENSRLALLEVKRGIFPVGGATIRLFQEIGWGFGMRYLLSGAEMSAQEAYRLGLVQEVAETGQQVEKALQIATEVAKAAPLSVQAALASARKARVEGPLAAHSSLGAEIMPIMTSKDSQEGLMAFLERREPNFIGE